MDYVVVDTNIASLGVKRELPPRLLDRAPIVTFVTVGELIKWAETRSWGERRRGTLDHWLSQRVIIHGDEGIARTWGRIAAAAARRGRPSPDNDTWIAACCLALQLPLATRNVKDFADFVTHEGLRLIEA